MSGNSIAQLESDVVWGIITANPAMVDGDALFHTNHKNLAGVGAALAVDSVGAARAAMAPQTGFDRKTVLNVHPAILIVPAALELKAGQRVAQNLVPADSTKVVSQSIWTLSPISEPRLDAASPTSWCLASSRNQIVTIEYAYLEGQQGAYIETRNGFDVDGVEIKCRHSGHHQLSRVSPFLQPKADIHYNTGRPHLGCRNMDRRPIETVMLFVNQEG